MSHLKYRKTAVEIEIVTRINALKVDGLISQELDLSTKAGIIKALDAALHLKGGIPYFKKLKGLFAYDIQFSPEYMHCLKMKDKIKELRKLTENIE